MRKRIWIPVVGLMILMAVISLGRMWRADHGLDHASDISSGQDSNPSNSGSTLHREIQGKLGKRLLSRAPKWDAELLEPEEWAKVFPYQPEYHPTLTYAPTRYHPREPSTWNMDQDLGEAVKRHGYMARFYDNTNRFSKEFQKLYLILDQSNRSQNPYVAGSLFNNLTSYHRANQHDSDALTTRIRFDEQGNEMQVSVDGVTTWGMEASSSSNSLIAFLTWPRHWPEQGPMPEDQAIELAQRLIAEIPPEGFLSIPHGQGFAYDQTKELELKPGDPLLVR